MTRSTGVSGFTLIEMVVCLGILALIATFTASGFALIRRGGALIARVESQDDVRAVQTHLRRAITGATPVFVERDGTAELLFEGAPDQLSLVTRSDRRLEGGARVLAGFMLEATPDQKAFVTIRRVLKSPNSGPAQPLRRVLLDQVLALRFRYFGSVEQGGPKAWMETWGIPNRLPELIEVSLQTQPGSGWTWSTMVVALPAAY